MKILLIRHARMSGDPFCCPPRPVSGCLSEELGVPQARALANALRDTPIHYAFSSPYGRALQTAEAVLAGRDTPLAILDCLREWLPNRDLDAVPRTVFEEMIARDGGRYAEETWKTEMGEGCFDMYARVIPPFLKALGDLGIHSRMGGFVAEAPMAEATIAVFAHGGSLAVLCSHLLRIPPFPVAAVRLEETGVATLVFAERQGIFYPALSVPAPGRAPKA